MALPQHTKRVSLRLQNATILGVLLLILRLVLDFFSSGTVGKLAGCFIQEGFGKPENESLLRLAKHLQRELHYSKTRRVEDKLASSSLFICFMFLVPNHKENVNIKKRATNFCHLTYKIKEERSVEQFKFNIILTN